MIMYPRLLMCAVLLVATNASSLMAQVTQGGAEIHWSEKTTAVSPDKKWQVDVSPQGEDGPAVVSVQNISSKRRHVLFHLQRDASLAWSPDSMHLIVVDQLFSDHYRLMVFHSPFSQNEQEALRADRALRLAVMQNLSSSEHINYYLPEVAGWRDGGWLVAVGVTALHDDSGPFTSQCFGYLLSPATGNVSRSFSEAELKEKYGFACQSQQ